MVAWMTLRVQLCAIQMIDAGRQATSIHMCTMMMRHLSCPVQHAGLVVVTAFWIAGKDRIVALGARDGPFCILYPVSFMLYACKYKSLGMKASAAGRTVSQCWCCFNAAVLQTDAHSRRPTDLRLRSRKEIFITHATSDRYALAMFAFCSSVTPVLYQVIVPATCASKLFRSKFHSANMVACLDAAGRRECGKVGCVMRGD